MKKKLAIYVHIPFCIRKCAYCDFLSAPAAKDVQERYVRALQCEIQSAAACGGHEVCSVFFGGGTPSILEAGQIAGILDTLRECFVFAADTEITIECNPGTLDAGKLSSYRQAGVNRLSIGLQSADDHELALLGRIHTWEDFLNGYRMAREAGFDNVNVDLMSALPGQTLVSYEETLQKVAALRPEHISAYSLIIEEGTPFYARYGQAAEDEKKKVREKCRGPAENPEYGEKLPQRVMEASEKAAALPDEDTERAMYALTKKLLCAAGYRRYEISNYALPGKECRHNICYWERTEYIGFGLGAASLFGERRYSNERDLLSYFEAAEQGRRVCGEIQELHEKDRMEEFMFLGLRMMRGVSRREFRLQFGRDIEEIYGDVLGKYQRLGLLGGTGDRIFLTERGIDVSNTVFCDFLL